jgi:tRNA(Ile2) C34 agmatinyltransferase TiaS
MKTPKFKPRNTDCLICGTRFKSKYIGNRVCNSCKNNMDNPELKEIQNNE